MCDPRPGRLGPILAEPATRPPTSATTVRPGGGSNQAARPIADVLVIGVPDERYGEELMAWVVLREGAESLTVDEVREFATGKLAHYKIPRYVHVTDAFPMTVTGKVRKVEMREQARQLLQA